MIDYFALLQQPRRPWLDAEKLKETYRRLTIVSHPDRQSAAEAPSDFSAINEAYRVLLDPKLRVQHLLKLEGMPTDAGIVPETLSDIFLETGALIQDIHRVLTRTTTTSLSKALMQPEVAEKQKLATDLLEKLHGMYNGALQELQSVDHIWMSSHEIAQELTELSSKLAYLTRWIAQLEERRFQLSIL